MDTTLVIMAAGMGSRFSKNELKQLSHVGPHQEIIMDYSIYDALKAGFNKVVFVIRKDIQEAFDKAIGNRMRQIVKVEYIYQEMDDLLETYPALKERTKPLGTGHAILCCKDVVKEPFMIINADDYYGASSFQIMHDYLIQHASKNQYCMVGFELKNTLSENGGVSRGICTLDHGKLKDVKEITNILKEDQKAYYLNKEDKNYLDTNCIVSMNMWGAHPSIFEYLEKEFKVFLDNMSDPIKDEYLLPALLDQMVKEQLVEIEVLKSKERWFGVTYQEDKAVVKEAFESLVRLGKYPNRLFEK